MNPPAKRQDTVTRRNVVLSFTFRVPAHLPHFGPPHDVSVQLRSAQSPEYQAIVTLLHNMTEGKIKRVSSSEENGTTNNTQVQRAVTMKQKEKQERQDKRKRNKKENKK